MQNNYSYGYQKRFLLELAEKYPFLTVEGVGRSRLGRSIYAVNYGNTQGGVLYAGGFHGAEWLTCMCLLQFTEKIAESINKNEALCGREFYSLINKRGICIIPCVNPDGVEIAMRGAESGGKRQREIETVMKNNPNQVWSANAAGVDINHNFNAGREEIKRIELSNGIIGPSPRRFCGAYAESEPETRTIANLCRHKAFAQAMALHSQGEEIYWKYGKHTPECSYSMAKALAELSGYTLVENRSLASHGGFKDWFIDELHKPAFTIEIGKGKNPLPEAMVAEIMKRIEKMLVEFAFM